jgi:hypothetical protein
MVVSSSFIKDCFAVNTKVLPAVISKITYYIIKK